MDRMFLIDPSWDEKENIDAYVARHVLQRYASRSCDHWAIGDPNASYNTSIVPVGDLEWVGLWLNKAKGCHVRIPPIEIPECLRHFCHREYQILRGTDIPSNQRTGATFLKDASVLKSWNNVLYEGMDAVDMTPYLNLNHLYVVSERVEFLSEWRIFVYNDAIVAAQNYLGDPALFPDRNTLRAMISTYRTHEPNRPKAYTIDVGILSKTYRGKQRFNEVCTEPIELHPMVACGLYGFYAPELLRMWEAGWQWCLENAF